MLGAAVKTVDLLNEESITMHLNAVNDAPQFPGAPG